VPHRPQVVCEASDHIEIPPIEPEVTRITLQGGTRPCCARRFKAPAPQDMPKAAPFGENLRALVIDLRFTRGIAVARLATLRSDLPRASLPSLAKGATRYSPSMPAIGFSSPLSGISSAAPAASDDDEKASPTRR